MPVMWAAISGHGYGHAAQVVPVLNELGKVVRGLRVILRTTVPASFFADRLTIPWELQPVQQDIGCIQDGPLRIDVPATWESHRRFHTQWQERMTQEVAAIRSSRPQVIVADTPYLAIAAGAEAGIPTVGLATFTWNEILAPLSDPAQPAHQPLLRAIEGYYRYADAAFRIAPGLTLSPFRKVTDIGPIAQPAIERRKDLRTHCGVPDRDRLVLVGFGGVPLASLPWDRMEKMEGFRFIVDQATPHSCSRIHSLSTLPYGFGTVLASVDAVMTKPGYGTVIESVGLGIPVVYVRRYNFADEGPLVDFVIRHGRAYELGLQDFLEGRWESALNSVFLQAAQSHHLALDGAKEAASHLAHYF